MNHPFIPSNPQDSSNISNDTPTPRVVTPKLSLKQLLFSFKGRIPRKTYWLIEFAKLLVVAQFIAIENGTVNLPLRFSLFDLTFSLFFIWITLAVTVKRWHDRGKSGWMFLVSFIPLIGVIWAFIETGCLRGTVGRNKYGEDPTDSD